ncbi:MAG: Hsp20 family protein, partial [Planctomycetia bacterium]
MSLIKWEPMREMESFFDRCARNMGLAGNGVQELMTTADWTPRVDISESENAFLIKAEVPGVKKEDVKVNLEDGVLS